ncbi:peptide deformylase, mitochondrial [Nilaparvata lugens]|uniref:peptide deformylase, mitochondrial n=1 Tax=Nilaparvata lugens TaxID=108931 RepID=UPI00193E7A66|nr:peptide deformylase, mitochondrial [Nilaparvata lugens]
MIFTKIIFSGKLNFHNHYRSFSLSSNIPKPPYSHIVQIGDPILRSKARNVDPKEFGTRSFNIVLNTLHRVFRKYESRVIGLSAPQIGINLRVFILSLKAKDIESSSNHVQKNVQEIPYQVWINPEMKVLDYKTVIHSEGCASFLGFSADVPRYKKVLLTGLDEEGNRKEWEACDWSARLVQHEMDHLDGILFTDKMHVRSLQCCGWSDINQTNGNIFITYSTTNWWFNLLHPRRIK